MRRIARIGVPLAVALISLPAGAAPSIVRLDLPQMVERVDGAVAGRIVEAWTTWHEMTHTKARVYSHLRIVGEDFFTGQEKEVVVSYFGGIFAGVDQRHPDMPSPEDVRVGNRVVAFYKWSEGMGGVGMNGLYASFGGIFRVESGPRGEVVIGRGEGFAVDRTRVLSELRGEVATLRANVESRRGGKKGG
jgi:hypothetical protein